jgi:hypothetical protein
MNMTPLRGLPFGVRLNARLGDAWHLMLSMIAHENLVSTTCDVTAAATLLIPAKELDKRCQLLQQGRWKFTLRQEAKSNSASNKLRPLE